MSKEYIAISDSKTIAYILFSYQSCFMRNREILTLDNDN